MAYIQAIGKEKKGGDITKIVGCFSEMNGDKYPSITTMIQKEPDTNKAVILAYMKKFPSIAVSTKTMRDVITGEIVGKEITTHTDGEYGWRSDTVYYVEKYNLQLPTDFVKKAISVQTKQ